MKTRRYSLLTLALLLMVSVLNVRAQAPDAFYIYKNDGTTMPFFNDLVDSVKWSNYDLDGNYHRVAVVQEVYTADSLYRIPLELIDSIGFHKPENKYTADAVRMEQQPWWEYVTEYIDTLNVILLRQDIPEAMMPKVGDKLVTVVQNDIFPGGFMGKVVHIEPNPEDGQQVVICERLDFKDVFTEFTASAGFVAQDPATAAARAETPQKRHINIDKTIHWPKVDFLGGSWGLQVGASWDLGDDKSKSLGGGITFGYEPDYDIELWVHYSIETGLEYQYKHRGTVNLKRTYNIQGTGSYHKDLDFGHYKWAIPNCPLLWWYVEPGVFVDASVTVSLNWFTQQKYHDYVFVSYKEYEPDLNVYTARTWDETPAESSSASYSLSGSLSAGFYTEIGLRLPPAPRLEDNDAKYLMGRIQLGARIEGSTEVDIKEAIVKAFTDASVYRWLNNEASFAVTAFLSGELKLQTPFGGNFFYSLPFEVTASLGTKFGIVPSFDNVDVTTGKLDSIYYAICKSDVARNLVIPARNMGFTIRDGLGKTVSRVGDRFYWFSTFENMTDTIRGLEPGIQYSLHPSFDFLGVIPMLGYPNKDFTVGELELDIKPQPIVATRERNVLRLPILTNARRTGVEVVEGAGWLHAVTDSLTLLVRTDSLPGNQPRSGKLMLKATTSDDTNELQIEVYVNQRTDRMIELEPQSLEFPALGGTKQVKATLMEPDRKLSVTGLPEWLKISISGTAINVTAEPNPDEHRPRTCTLIVLAENEDGSRAEQPVEVKQGCENPALIIEPQEIVLDGIPQPNTGTWIIGKFSVKAKNKDLAHNPKVTPDKDLTWTNQYFDSSRYRYEGDYIVFDYEVGTEEVYFGTESRQGKINVHVELTDGTTADGFVVVKQNPAEPAYRLSTDEVTLDPGNNLGYSQSQQVQVETNLTIGNAYKDVVSSEIKPSDSWIHVSGEWWGPISIIATSTLESEPRIGTVTIQIKLKNGDVIDRTIKVTQKGTVGGDTFTIDPARLEFPGAGGEKTLTIVPQNGAQIDRIWEVDCHTAGNSWLNGSGMNLTAIMYAEPNTTSEWRQRDFAITVLMKDGTKVTQNYVAYQKPAGIDLYPSNSVQFDGLGGFKSMNIESSFEPVTITCDADWLEVERSGNGLFLTAQTNPGDHRNVTVYFTANAPDGKQVTAHLFVSQTASTGHFRTEPSSFTFEAEGGSKSTNFFFSKEIKDLVVGEISVSTNDSWISYEKTNSGKSLQVTAAANPTAVERKGVVNMTCTLSNGTVLSFDLKVTQKAGAAEPITLSLSPSSLNFGDTGGSGNVSVTTDADASNISVKASASWIHATRSGTTISVSTDANTSTSSRSGSVTVTVSQNGQTVEQTVSVSQSGKGGGDVGDFGSIAEITVIPDCHTDDMDEMLSEEWGNGREYKVTVDKVTVSQSGSTVYVTGTFNEEWEDTEDWNSLQNGKRTTASTVSFTIENVGNDYNGSVIKDLKVTRHFVFSSYESTDNGRVVDSKTNYSCSNIPWQSYTDNTLTYYGTVGGGITGYSYSEDDKDNQGWSGSRHSVYNQNNSMKVVIKKGTSPTEYSGAFIGDWRSMDSSSPFTVRLNSDGSFYKKVGSQAAVTGSYTLISYSYDENSKTFTGKLREPDGHTVSFNGGGSGSGWDYVEWMIYDGVKVSTNFDM